MMPPVPTTQPSIDETKGCSSQPEEIPKTPLVSPKKVRFSRRIDVREVPHMKDLTKEDTEATWYSAVEFEEIRQSLVVTVRMMMAKKPVDDTLCTRGLEFRTPSGAKRRKRNKLNALTAVWNEQVAQWREDRTDELAIAFVYEEHVRECRQFALTIAQRDAMEARRIMCSMDESGSDLSDVSISSGRSNEAFGVPQMAVLTPSAA
eukprot:Nitzschia sp. Nitz4//scaffold56_size114212//110105//110719//NITZ4_003975-RA/size114212-processed-gene-0.78-mRNA-1//-1//CDS//3329554781//8814//frame0